MSVEHGAVTSEEPRGVEAAAGWTTLAEGLQHLRDLLDAGNVDGARRFIKELEVRWPASERVRHYARVLAPPTVRMRSDIKVRPLDREWEWLRQHAHEHPGCWLAVLRGQLVAADPDGSVVRSKAREIPGVDRPLIYYSPTNSSRRESPRPSPACRTGSGSAGSFPLSTWPGLPSSRTKKSSSASQPSLQQCKGNAHTIAAAITPILRSLIAAGAVPFPADPLTFAAAAMLLSSRGSRSGAARDRPREGHTGKGRP
jgi:hypothetical protein